MKTLVVNRKIVVSVVAVMVLIYGLQGTGYGEPQNDAPEFTPVCDRTPQVRDAIVSIVPGVSDCKNVTQSHLALITNLNLSDQNITTLKAGDFDGLSSLRILTLYKNTLSSLPVGIFSGLSSLNRMDIGSNQLSSLPVGIFSGLSSLNRLNLSYNRLTNLPADSFSGLSSLSSLSLSSNRLSSLPADIFSGLSALDWLSLSSNRLIGLPDGIFSGLSSIRSLYLGDNSVHLLIAVSLESVGEGQFKAMAPTGAPFNIVLPFSVTNGNVDGETTTITIPAGSVESEPLTITRTPGTVDAITVDIGTLPGVPTGHYGYRLAKSSTSDGDNTPVSFAISIPDYKPQINNAPAFTAGSGTTRSVAENTPAGVNIGGAVSATDADGDILTYSLGGIDGASFGVVSTTGQLKTRAPLDYETKNAYTVTVTVSDGDLTDLITVGITVTDVEENQAPVFTAGSGTTRSIPENTSAGVNIGGPVSATDADGDILTYSLGGIDGASFGIVSTSGQLKTRAPLDYETKNSYLVTVTVSDGSLTASITVGINVTDVDENRAPVFTAGSGTTRSIPENTPAGVNIGGPVSATDADGDILTYSLGGIDGASFGVVSTSGQLKTRASLDYETKNSYLVTVMVSDGSLTDEISVGINVTDVDENRAPVFTAGSGTTRSVAENTPAGVNIGGPVSATDADGDILTYSLGGIDGASFGVVSTSGQLQTRAPLDYETKNSYLVTVMVSDGKLTDEISVGITVIDVDETPTDHAPVFTEGSGTTRAVAENTPAGVNIGGAVVATDADDDILTYGLGGIDGASFGIVSTTGQLKTRAPLDYETKSSYLVTVIVSDGSLTDSITVGITVTDVDENRAPIFTEGSGTTRAVAENTPAGVNIGGAVFATDADGDTLTYGLSGIDAELFGIVSTTGQLKTRAPLDYETKNSYLVMVAVSDGKLTDSITVGITVTDVDENRAPIFTEGSGTTRAVAENTPAGVNIGGAVSATDADGDTLTYGLSGIDGASFGVVSTSGQLQIRAPLDYETKSSYLVTVIVSDGSLTDSITVGINVTDVDENRGPVFADSSTTRSIAENTPVGVNIGDAVSATDADSDASLTYTLSGTDAGSFDIDPTTGQIKTQASLDYETKNSYTVIVTASDGSLTASISVAISIVDVDENRGPVFPGSRTTRSVAENTPAGVSIGIPVSATDADGDTLTYSLDGTDASSFGVLSTSGQLKTRALLDYETKNDYLVTVTVSDGALTASISVAITIIDVDEVPPEPISSKVSISEIMYGSERRFTPTQWIELHNSGTDIIDLTGWTLTIQNRNSPDLTGPVNATITFEDDFWGDAPRIWPNETLLIVGREIGENSGNLAEDQIYDLGWRKGLGGLWYTFLSVEGFYIKLTDDARNLVDEAGNLDDGIQQWRLPFDANKGRTRAGRRTSMIRRYADSMPLDGTQAAGWISAVDANLTADQLTYYGASTDISTPGIGIIINELAPQFTAHDVNQDGVVNILDLVLIAVRFGQSGPNAADVNGDGVVNVLDLIKVAGALNQTAAAPSAHPAALAMLNAADVQGWLTQARELALTDAQSQRGIIFLEQLLSVLIPKETALLHNYPNPFNPETWIPYRLAHAADVEITIYNTRGTVVRRLDLGHQSAGFYTARAQAGYWNGRNRHGELVASGVYFYQLRAGDYSALRRMVIVK